jgi:hypothetical protein
MVAALVAVVEDPCEGNPRDRGAGDALLINLQNFVGGEAGLMHSFRRGDELKGNRAEDNLVRNAAQVRRPYFQFIFI